MFNPGPSMKSGVKFLALALLLSILACQKEPVSKPSPQNPSPMTESIRSHDRVRADSCTGKRIQWKLNDKSVQLFIPATFRKTDSTHLLIHFHGSARTTEVAVCDQISEAILTVTGGSGSSSYERIFEDEQSFEKLLDRTYQALGIEKATILTLSGWSAGYGAIRALISKYTDLVDRVLLLDGLHASYIPARQTLFEGGRIDSLQLKPFLDFAKKAVKGRKSMLITHSAIFPGTYASTTECTEYLIQKLGMERRPCLVPGPVGMQQVGITKAGKFSVLSFAGNTAPDHIDHLHGLSYFSNRLND